MALRLDHVRTDAKWERTQQGFLHADARLTRTGVLEYRRADGSTVRELRHPDDVFAPKSLASLGVGVPLTRMHPGIVNTHNVKTVREGALIENGRQDGAFVRARVQIETADMIADTAAGKLKEFSCGYTCDFDPTPGVWQGQKYDGRQTNIVYNHVGLGPEGWGRAGREVRLDGDSGIAIFDGADIPVVEHTTSEVSRMDENQLKTLAELSAKLGKIEAENAALKVRADAADKKVAELETALGKAETAAKTEKERADAATDPAELDKKTAARVTLITDARRVLGANEKLDGMSARQIHEKVITKVQPSVRLDRKSDDYVCGVFEHLVENVGSDGHPSLGSAAHAASGNKGGPPKEHADGEEYSSAKAYAESVKAKGSKWRDKPAA